jgi:hypothetical protein
MSIASQKVAWMIIVLTISTHGALSQSDRQLRIDNLKAHADTISHKLHVSYDLENSPAIANISVRLFSQEGMEMFLANNSAVGDQDSVVSGRNKKMTIDYPAFIRDIDKYTIEVIAEVADSIDVGKMVNAVSADRIKHDITSVPRQRNFHTAEGVRSLITTDSLINDNFRKYGLKPGRVQFRGSNNVTGTNFIGELKGVGNCVETIILSAHYDTVKDSPGVDDNLSGVAGMLEVMRVLSQYRFDNSINFIAFGMEEEGLVGSRNFVRRAIPLNRRINACINFDMIGYSVKTTNSQAFPNELKAVLPTAYDFVSKNDFKGDFILAAYDKRSSFIGDTFVAMAHKYQPDFKVLAVSIPENPRFAAFDAGDHYAFWEMKFPALSIGDTAEARNPNYHSKTDTIDSIDISFVVNVVKATVASIAKLASIRNAYRAECKIVTSASVLAGQ